MGKYIHSKISHYNENYIGTFKYLSDILII